VEADLLELRDAEAALRLLAGLVVVPRGCGRRRRLLAPGAPSAALLSLSIRAPWMLVTAPVTSSMVGGDQNTTLYSSSSISPGPATTSFQSPSSPSRRSARDSQYAAAATAEGGGGELARSGRPPATGRGRGDAAEVEAPALAPRPEEEDDERTARLVRRRRCLPGGFLIAGRR
jgi:hypothetical protein